MTPITFQSPADLYVNSAPLAAQVATPDGARGIVLIVRGPASCDRAIERSIIERLARIEFAAMDVDLLTPTERRIDTETSEYCYDVDFLARRLTGVVQWALRTLPLAASGIGIVSSGIDASASLITAADPGNRVRALVCRNGRYDIVRHTLGRVRARALLQIAAHDRTFPDAVDAVGRLPTGSAIDVIESESVVADADQHSRRVGRAVAGWFHRGTEAPRVPQSSLRSRVRV